MRHALDWLHDNPTEKPTTAARLHFIANEHSVQQAWRRKKKESGRKRSGNKGGAGNNRILPPDQHYAMIRYAADHATGGIGATKQMLFNCAMYLRVKEHKPIPSWRWF